MGHHDNGIFVSGAGLEGYGERYDAIFRKNIKSDSEESEDSDDSDK